MPRDRRWLALGLAVVLASPHVAAQAPGSPELEFILRTLDGDSVRLSAQRGHPVVVNFWGTWCPPCRDEIPLLVAEYATHKDSGLVILAVDGRDQETSTKAVREFAAEFHIPFPVLLDEKGNVRKRYKLRGLPTTVFIGADGVIRAVNIGPLSETSLQLHLAEILPAR